MKRCFYCELEVIEIHNNVERNCVNCKDMWFPVHESCKNIYEGTPEKGWSQHYQAHHPSVDLI